MVEDREVRTFSLSAAVTTIGRAQDNDIVINNLALSRRHAEVHRRGSSYELVDRGSQNGVFVNDERLDGPRLLADTDVVTLGTYTFIFADDGPPSGTEALPSDETTPPVPAAPSQSRVSMVVLTFNELELQRYPLKKSECLIGRAKECDIQIAERRLSRRHCLLFQGEDAVWMVRDLDSQNGTYVNRKRVRTPQDLRHGDVLNFAEYSIRFLSDVEAYDGPDAVSRVIPPRAASGVEQEQTELPEAYRDYPAVTSAPDPVVTEPPRMRRPRPPMGNGSVRHRDLPPAQALDVEDRGPSSSPAHESSVRVRAGAFDSDDRVRVRAFDSNERVRIRALDSDDRGVRVRAHPVVEPDEEGSPVHPSREHADVSSARTSAVSSARPPRRRPPGQRRGEMPGPRSGASVAPSFAEVDVPDPVGDRPRPDPKLDEWYDARRIDEYDEEPSVLLERSKSSISQLLSTMMVDKRELERNLEVARRSRRFAVEVRWGEEVIYSGRLDRDVTVLGTDRESDIPLRGRYVAGRHSLLVRVLESLLLVRLGSSSAARVNGLPRLQAFLKSGDIIQIDETTIHIDEV